MTSDVEPRKLYTFLIRAGIRLEARNRTVCSAIMLTYRCLQNEPFAKAICHYTLASTCLLLAAKLEEDSTIGIRDVVNVTHRLLHPDEELLKIGTALWDIRKGLAKLEFVVLRELNFDINFSHPFQTLALYLDQLRYWMPQQFEENHLSNTAITICRDCYVSPELIMAHSPESIAIACIALAMDMNDVGVPFCREWYEVLNKRMTSSKLASIQEEILQQVYNKKVNI